MVSRKEASFAFKWAAINAVVSLIVKLAILVGLSRVLGPYEFGVYNIGMAIVLILSTVGQLGIPTNIITFNSIRPGVVSLGIGIGVFSASILSVLCGIALWFYDSGLFQKNTYLIILFGMLLILQIAVNILEALTKRELNFRLLATNELGASILGNGIIPAVLALSGWQSMALVMGQLVYSFIKLSMLSLRNRNTVFQVPRFSEAANLMNGAWSIMIAESANMATVHMQRPMVGRVLGASAAGIWSRVYQIIVIQLTLVVQPLDNIVLPIFSRIRNDKEKFSSALFAAIQMVGITTLPIAAITIIFTPLMVPILFGPAWEELEIPLQIGSIIVFFRGIERVLLSVSRATGTMKARAAIQVVQLALIMVFLLPALEYGLVVSSWAYIVALALGFSISLAFMYRTTGIKLKDVIVALIPGILLAGIPLALGTLATVLLGEAFGGAISICVVTMVLAAMVVILCLNTKRYLSPMLATAISAQVSSIRLHRVRGS